MARILLIDDDTPFAEEVAGRLSQLGHRTRHLDCAEQALALLTKGDCFDAILLDNKMPRMSGLEFLEAAGRTPCRVPVILMTSAHHDATVIRAINLGAFGYVIKPLDLDELMAELAPMLDEAVEVSRRPTHVPISQQTAAAAAPGEESALVGRSRPMIALLTSIGRLAKMDETVLILGETGTGKDLVARALHTNSGRRNGPFVALNCSAFNEHLLDDELFGHEPGAFTGAVKLRKGRCEHARGGTLFLDEAGDMPLPLQAKLLRVLENREIVRLGSNDPIAIDARVLAATHCDLAALVRQGKFREDLYYRLAGVTIHLPPLRERKGDVEELTGAFLRRAFPDAATRPALHPLALQKLVGYPWPGNVRQLHKVLRRAAGVCRGLLILPEDVEFGGVTSPEGPAGSAGSDTPPTPGDPLAGLQALIEAAWRGGQPRLWDHLHDLLDRELFAHALRQGVSQVELKDRLGKSRNYVRERLKQLGFEAAEGE